MKTDPDLPALGLAEGEYLTSQEREILRLLAEGLPADIVARKLDISDRTIRRRMRHLCWRFGVRTPIQVIVAAVRRGWI